MSHPVYVTEDFAAFDLLATLIWVVDLDTGIQFWANQACLPMWGAASREDLLARSVTSRPPSDASRTRLDALRRRYERGERSLDRWTLYPDAAPPFRVECKSSGIYVAAQRGDPGKLAMLVEGRLLTDEDIDVNDRRGVEALRYLGELVSLYTPEGSVLMRNPVAVRVLGDPGPGDALAVSLGDPAIAAAARAEIAAGAVFRHDCCLYTDNGPRWFATAARGSLDPVTGRMAILVTQTDISERRVHMAALSQQAETLRRLSAPVLQVGAGVLALPLIGAVNSERITTILAVLNREIVGRKVAAVVLDLTGAGEFAEDAAVQLCRLAQSLGLQGIRMVFSGLRPEHAQTLAVSGQLRQISCFPQLATALHHLRQTR